MSPQFDPLGCLVACLKALRAEQTKAFNAGAKSGDLYAGYTDKQRAHHGETARDCAIQIRRLKHEAHCLAVELGIADLRADSHYTPVTAPAGFGREVLIERRRPNA